MKPKRIARWSAGAISLALVVAALGAYWTSDNDCARETHPRGGSMIAAIARDYGPPDVLRLEHVEKCAPTDDQFLVRFARPPSILATCTGSGARRTWPA